MKNYRFLMACVSSLVGCVMLLSVYGDDGIPLEMSIGSDQEVNGAPVLNAGLEGKLYFRGLPGEDRDAYVELDIVSGIVHTIRASRELNSEVARAVLWGDAFTLYADEHLSGKPDTKEIAIFGRDGRTLSRFEMPSLVKENVRLSPDGQLLAIEVEGQDYSSNLLGTRSQGVERGG